MHIFSDNLSRNSCKAIPNCPLTVSKVTVVRLRELPSKREYSYSKMTEKRHGISVNGELTVFLKSLVVLKSDRLNH